MRKIKFFNFDFQLRNARFVWQEMPAEGSPKPTAEDRLKELKKAAEASPLRKRGALTAAAREAERQLRGEASPYIPQKPVTPEQEPSVREIPINPTVEVLRDLKRDMDSVFKEVFGNDASTLSTSEFQFEPEKVSKYMGIITELRDAMLMRAVIQNRSRRELLNAYKEELTNWKNELKQNSYPGKAWNWIKGLALRAVSTDPKRALSDTKNPHLKEGPLLLRDKAFISQHLNGIENHFFADLKEQYGGTFTDDYNPKATEFVKESLIPFYKDYYLNRAIVEGWNAQTLIMYYSKIVSVIASCCIKNQATREKQVIKYTEQIRKWNSGMEDFPALTRALDLVVARNPTIGAGTAVEQKWCNELEQRQIASFDLAVFD